MDDFPLFMKTPENSMSPFLHAKGAEGWVYDGRDGKQMAYWVCHDDVVGDVHKHDFDEYFIVVAGEFRMVIDDNEKIYKTGDECYIPAGTEHSGFAIKGTRTIHCFGGKRA